MTETGRRALLNVMEEHKPGLMNATILLPNMKELSVKETGKKLENVTLILVRLRVSSGRFNLLGLGKLAQIFRNAPDDQGATMLVVNELIDWATEQTDK